VFGMLISLLLPTIQTIAFSFESGGLLEPTEFVGTANYGRVLGAGEAFWPALGFTLSITIVPLLVALVAGPLVALALDRAGTWVRRAGRVALSLAIVVFSPAAVAVSWLRGLRADADGLVVTAAALGDPATAPGTFRLIVAATTFGVVCALAVLAFLPALRGGTVTGAMLVVAGLVTLATVAAGLQTFTTSLVLTRGGPVDSTMTPALLQYTLVFQSARLGLGATVATVSGAILGVLGLAATVLVVASGTRLSLIPRTATGQDSAPGRLYGSQEFGSGGSYGSQEFGSGGPPGKRPAIRRPSAAGVAVGVLALAAFCALTLVWAWPWLSALVASDGGTRPPTGPRVHLNTWVPALLGALVSVGVAYLGALGIGGLRPLGRHSEWLLLAFAPWLFVGSAPLSVARWNTLRGIGLLDTFVALIPPVLVSVPALFVLTLLCRGLARRAGRDFLGGVVLPSLPMAGLAVVAVTLLNAQDLLWPLLVAQHQELATAPVTLMLQVGEYDALSVETGLSTPLIAMVLALAAAVAAQLRYLDRLVVTVGRDTGSSATVGRGTGSRVPAPPA